jgi:hypothetical protein
VSVATGSSLPAPLGSELTVLDYRTALALTFTMGFLGLVLPYGLPLYAPLAAYTFFCLVATGRLRVPMNGGVLLLALTVAFYLVGLLRTDRIFAQNLGDLRNLVGVALTVPALAALGQGDDFEVFRRRLARTCAWTLGLVSILALAKFALLVRGIRLDVFRTPDGRYPWGTSLVDDYNFFAYGMMVGTVSCLFWQRRARGGLERTALRVLAVLTVVAGILSSSRRYWVVAGLAALVLLALGVRELLRAAGRLARGRAFVPRTAVWLGSLILLAGVAYATWRVVSWGLSGQAFQVLFVRLATLQTGTQSLGSRTERWALAGRMLQDGSPLDLLIGQGFRYIHRFALAFSVAGGEDYPHNPILSAALYSGIPGAVAVGAFMAASFVTYLRRRVRGSFFLTLFAFGILFILPSENSMFSAKFFPLLLILPWMMPGAGEAAAADRSPWEAAGEAGDG